MVTAVPDKFNKPTLGSFFRAAIPQDVLNGSPNPSNWGSPSATLSNSTCNIKKYFVDHSIVFGQFSLFRSLRKDLG